MIKLSRFGDVARSPEEAYLPFLAAIEAERLDPTTVPLHDPHEAAIEVRNGCIPEQGAVMELPGDKLAAFDHVAFEWLSGREAVVAPSSKDAIDGNTGAVRRTGGLVRTDQDGGLTVHGVFERRDMADWRPQTHKAIGDVSLRWLWPGQRYEVIEIDSGIVVARTPMRFF